MKYFLFLTLFYTIGCNTFKKNSTIDNTASSIIDTFFSKIKKEPQVALEDLLKTNPHILIEDSVTLNLKDKFNNINENAGVFMGYKLLKKRFIDDDIGIYSYLAKYEVKFYRFIFVFYNNDKNIKLYKFMFNDDLDEELEASLKYYIND